MRKYLLGEKGHFYKANLHCHSTKSDGKLTPEELKEAYKQKGYSVLAYSDHDALHCNYELTDSEFLALTAYEISIRNEDNPNPHAFQKIVDLNLIAKEPYHLTQVGYHPETVSWLVRRGKMNMEQVNDIKYVGPLRDLHIYPANINRIIKSANDNGFLVCINHSNWNLTNFSDYGCFEGAWAIEIYNHGTYALSGLPDSETVYDDILRSGKYLYCIATDDNHNSYPFDDYKSDSFGGFTMIEASGLDYASIIQALEKGHFYASTGPEIYQLYYEDGIIHIECSPCADICMTTLGRKGDRAASPDGTFITSADFKVDPELFGAVRFRITDVTGKKAYTNAYYVDELDESATPRRVIL